MNSNAIEAVELRKVYGAPGGGASHWLPRWRGRSVPSAGRELPSALGGLCLQVREGEVFGLLGPNGAGKSTTMGILTTRIRPTSGRATVMGLDVATQAREVKACIGVVPQHVNLDQALTCRENLTFHGAYFAQRRRERQRRADELLERFGLTDSAERFPPVLSGGQQRRLLIARALMHEPRVLLLDEPSAGLDPQSRLLLWDVIKEFNRRGNTVVLATHNMEEADSLCDRVAIVDRGSVLAVGSAADLKRSMPGGYAISLGCSDVTPALTEELGKLSEVVEVRTMPIGVQVFASAGGTLVPAIVKMAAQHGAALHNVQIAEPSLESLFLRYTGRSLRA